MTQYRCKRCSRINGHAVLYNTAGWYERHMRQAHEALPGVAVRAAAGAKALRRWRRETPLAVRVRYARAGALRRWGKHLKAGRELGRAEGAGPKPVPLSDLDKARSLIGIARRLAQRAEDLLSERRPVHATKGA